MRNQIKSVSRTMTFFHASATLNLYKLLYLFIYLFILSINFAYKEIVIFGLWFYPRYPPKCALTEPKANCTSREWKRTLALHTQLNIPNSGSQTESRVWDAPLNIPNSGLPNRIKGVKHIGIGDLLVGLTPSLV